MRAGVAGLAVANLGFVAWLGLNHARFPLNLCLLDLAIWQHFARAASGLAIYPAPGPEFVPFDYNPLYYYLSVPFGRVFGVSLFTLRLVSMLAYAGSALIVYGVVRARTGERWWALAAAGLFAAAYNAMESAMGSAHPDSCLLFFSLLGTLLIDRPGRARNLAGVLVLIAAFWTKQQGAAFLAGGLAFLTWRDGVRKTWPYWLLAVVLVPVFAVAFAPTLFGSHFHYFTWTVPRQWSEPRLRGIGRYGVFLLRYYLVVGAGAGAALLATLADRTRLDAWRAQLPAAAFTGLVGILDHYSSDNVFIPIGTWLIVVGTIGLHEMGGRRPWTPAALLASFLLLAYDPRNVVVSSRAASDYARFVQRIAALGGTVYAPGIGQLESDFRFVPAGHWVALEDMVRGPGRSTDDQPLVRASIAPALDPPGQAFLVASRPLAELPALGFLTRYYVLDADWGDEFASLRVIPGRWDFGWPRYLYRYRGAAPAQATGLS
jgi:hypothetical protein